MMNHLTDIKFLKDLFRHYNIRPKDYMGQNFLVDEDVLSEILKAADLKITDTVLEVGPGLGVLTTELLKTSKKVVAVEKDKRLVPILEKQTEEFNNLEIINEDILRFDFSSKLQEKYKVVANIPYYLTSHLVQLFLTARKKPELMVLLMQKEVGERMVAKPGQLSLLALSAQFFADVEIAAVVSQNSFWPVPKVDSVIIKIRPKEKLPAADEKFLFRIAKIGFSGKRKQLHNTLSAGLKLSDDEVKAFLESIGIKPEVRPQELSLDQWVKLSQMLAKNP